VKKEEAFHWRRHLLLVKQPDYLVVWDEIVSPMPSEWFLHTTAERLVWEKERVTCRTAYNADLDVHVISPAGALVPNEKEGPFGSWLYDNPKRGKEDPYPFMKLKYFTIPARPGQSFVTILHPRKPADPGLRTSVLSASPKSVAIRIVLGERTDLIRLEADGGSFQRNGSAAVALPMRVDDNTKASVPSEPSRTGGNRP
jgi:hypothetical protein